MDTTGLFISTDGVNLSVISEIDRESRYGTVRHNMPPYMWLKYSASLNRIALDETGKQAKSDGCAFLSLEFLIQCRRVTWPVRRRST